MELRQDAQSAHEDPAQQDDKREQVEPPAPMRLHVPDPKVPGWHPDQTAGQQYPPQPYRPDFQQPVIAHAAQGRTAASSNSQANGDNGSVGNTPTGMQTAQIGSAITLAGLSTGEQISVTVTKVYSDAQPVDQYNEAPVGDRLYAVAFQLKNTGGAGYSDAPGNSAIVFDSNGQSYQTQFDNVTECQSFQAVVDIPVGSSSLGCIVYEVPNNAKITKVQVILDSGYGPQTGAWKVSKSRSER